MYHGLSGFYPKNLQKKYVALLKYAGIKINPYQYMGFILAFGFGIALSTSLILASIYDTPVFLTTIGIFLGIEGFIYTMLTFNVDRKARFVENVLPDALQMMSSNLRAGFTTDRALLLSARPEFGIFKDELNRVGKEITTGKEVTDALLTMKEHINSIKLHRTISLIVSGMRSGGELASLLDETASNLRQQKFVDERVKSNIMMYVIFIGAAVVVGAPILFALSSFLVRVFSSNMGSMDMMDSSASATMPIKIGEVSLPFEFVSTYSMVSIITSAIMGSLIIGLILKGKEVRGLQYIPMMVGLSLGVYFITKFAINSFMVGLFGI